MCLIRLGCGLEWTSSGRRRLLALLANIREASNKVSFVYKVIAKGIEGGLTAGLHSPVIAIIADRSTCAGVGK